MTPIKQNNATSDKNKLYRHVTSLKSLLEYKARTDIRTFIDLVFDDGYDELGHKKQYNHDYFTNHLCNTLTKFYDELESGKRPRYVIQAPPRHGKTLLTSIMFIAWAFGRNPNNSVIATSYSKDLVRRNSVQLQNLMTSEQYKRIFKDVDITVRTDKKTKRTQTEFSIGGHRGYYYSTGMGGGITGMGADILLVDDIVKEISEATPSNLNKIYEWFTSTAYTRLSPKGGVFVIMTRWSENDLIGKLLEKQAINEKAYQKGEGDNNFDKWEVVRFAAIAEEDEEFRKKGEALCPNRYNIQQLMTIYNQIGKTQFEALFQQNPRPADGELMNRKDFRVINDIHGVNFRKFAIFCDTAHKKGQQNDFSVFLLAGQVIINNITYVYILDILRKKLTAPELEEALKAFYTLNVSKYGKMTVHIEDKASGIGLLQALKNEYHMKVEAVPARDSKITRFYSIQSMIETGRVLVLRADWNTDFFAECENFTSMNTHKHDDQVDAMVMACNVFRERRTTSMDVWAD